MKRCVICTLPISGTFDDYCEICRPESHEQFDGRPLCACGCGEPVAKQCGQVFSRWRPGHRMKTINGSLRSRG